MFSASTSLHQAPLDFLLDRDVSEGQPVASSTSEGPGAGLPPTAGLIPLFGRATGQVDLVTS
jgi:hypothetical protein